MAPPRPLRIGPAPDSLCADLRPSPGIQCPPLGRSLGTASDRRRRLRGRNPVPQGPKLVAGGGRRAGRFRPRHSRSRDRRSQVRDRGRLRSQRGGGRRRRQHRERRRRRAGRRRNDVRGRRRRSERQRGGQARSSPSPAAPATRSATPAPTARSGPTSTSSSPTRSACWPRSRTAARAAARCRPTSSPARKRRPWRIRLLGSRQVRPAARPAALAPAYGMVPNEKASFVSERANPPVGPPPAT